MDGRWIEVGDGVFVRRHGELDLTTGLVLGAEQALVIDTRGDGQQGAELASAVRRLTALPLVVAITHAHFDHCFGTGAFPGSPVFAQSRCADAVRATAAEQRAHWVGHYRDAGDQARAAALAATEPVPPDHPVCPHPGDRHELDLGGRTAVLIHPGPGHTGHDLAVHVPDVGVLFVGDLLENGAPPSHGSDAHPNRWADAVASLLSPPQAPDTPAGPAPHAFVPGHGDPMSHAQAAAQQAELEEVAALWRAVAAGGLTAAEADSRSPHPGVPWPPAPGH